MTTSLNYDDVMGHLGEVGVRAPSSATLSSRTYERIRDDIVLCTLSPGTKLILDQLKERYQVGMSPLREALHRLMATKLIILEERRGFSVATVSAAHLAEVVELRQIVEAALLKNSFEHASVQWEASVVAAFHALLRTADYKFNPGPYELSWEGAHRNFHEALLSANRLPMLAEFHESLWHHTARYRNLAFRGKQMSPDVFEGHEQLLNAAVARDAELACMLLKRHIDLATSHLMESIFPQAVSSHAGSANRR